MRPVFSMIVPFILCITCVSMTAGCICQPSVTGGTAVSPTANPVMGQLDGMLANGPVFLEFWSPECSWCTKQKPVLDELKSEYPGVSFVYVNTDEGGDLIKAFSVNGIPQMNLVAVKYDNGSYLYIDPSGKPTTDRKKSTILGYTEKEGLTPVLDAALKVRK